MDQSTMIALKLDRLQLLHHAHRRREMGRIGLWRGQMPILEYVLAHEGCSQKALADGLGLSAATVAVSTKRLSRAGLLTKCADEDNLRCNKLYVTECGRGKIEQGQALAREQDRQVFSVLNSSEQECLCDLLDRLIDSFGEGEREFAPLQNFILHNQLEQKEKD